MGKVAIILQMDKNIPVNNGKIINLMEKLLDLIKLGISILAIGKMGYRMGLVLNI